MIETIQMYSNFNSLNLKTLKAKLSETDLDSKSLRSTYECKIQMIAEKEEHLLFVKQTHPGTVFAIEFGPEFMEERLYLYHNIKVFEESIASILQNLGNV